jgi:hypothetical protein
MLASSLGQDLAQLCGLNSCYCHALAIQWVEGTDGVTKHHEPIWQGHLFVVSPGADQAVLVGGGA